MSKQDIEALEKGLNFFNKLKMNNELVLKGEPVAWMEIEEGGITEYKVWREPVSSKSIPLYTAEQLHPAKKLTGAVGSLSDEEIEQVMSKFYSYNPRLLEFAKAILRKAQEK